MAGIDPSEGKPGGRLAAVSMLCLAILLTGPGRASGADCVHSNGQAAVDACAAELRANPRDLKVRHALVSAYVRLRQYSSAIRVLEQGLGIYPDDGSLRTRLAEVKNLAREQQWLAKQAGESAGTTTSTNAKLNAIYCRKLSGEKALAACDAALKEMPSDATLLTGKGDALLSLHRVVDALATYRQVLARNPGNAEVQKKWNAAEEQRQKLVAGCMKLTGSAGVAACNDSLLKGAADQAAIQTRLGDILVDMHQSSKALEAYQVAHLLDPRNPYVKGMIARLSAPPPAVQAPTVPDETAAAEDRRSVGTSGGGERQVASADDRAATDNGAARDRTLANTELSQFTNAPLGPGVTY